MDKETRKEFKKQFNKYTTYSLTDKTIIIRDIIFFGSFANYWAFVMTVKKSTYNIAHINIMDHNNFTIKDYEFILWYGFIVIFKGFINEVKKSNMVLSVQPPKYSINQKMTAEIFNSEEYNYYIRSVLRDLPTDHTMVDYIISKSRQYTLNEIINS